MKKKVNFSKQILCVCTGTVYGNKIEEKGLNEKYVCGSKFLYKKCKTFLPSIIIVQRVTLVKVNHVAILVWWTNGSSEENQRNSHADGDISATGNSDRAVDAYLLADVHIYVVTNNTCAIATNYNAADAASRTTASDVGDNAYADTNADAYSNTDVYNIANVRNNAVADNNTCVDNNTSVDSTDSVNTYKDASFNVSDASV
jgi:hypothetical protein